MHESKKSPANTLIRQVLSLENNSAKYLHKASFQYTMHDSKNTQPNTLIREVSGKITQAKTISGTF